MNQGDVYWYTFRAPDKRRPVLILTRTSATEYLTAITIAPITSTIRGIPSEVVLTVADGLLNDCAANFDNIQTVQKSQLGAFITHLSAAKMRMFVPQLSSHWDLRRLLNSAATTSRLTANKPLRTTAELKRSTRSC